MGVAVDQRFAEPKTAPRRIPAFVGASLSPAVIFYTLFMLLPMVLSMTLSLYQSNGFSTGRFVGLDNFHRLFTDPLNRARLVGALVNNVEFFGIMMLAQNVGALGLAVLLSGLVRGAAVYRTLLIVPLTLSPLVVGFLWMLILNPTWGLFYQLVRGAGLGFLAQPWLGLPNTALPTVALINSWQWIGLPMLFFVAGIQSIPNELYDAARVDGASGWRLFGRITLPLLMPIIGTVSLLTFISNFTAFDIVYAIGTTEGQPNYATDIFGTLFYRTTFGRVWGGPSDVGLGAAIAVVMFVLVLVGVSVWFLAMRGEQVELA